MYNICTTFNLATHNPGELSFPLIKHKFNKFDFSDSGFGIVCPFCKALLHLFEFNLLFGEKAIICCTSKSHAGNSISLEAASYRYWIRYNPFVLCTLDFDLLNFFTQRLLLFSTLSQNSINFCFIHVFFFVPFILHEFTAGSFAFLVFGIRVSLIYGCFVRDTINTRANNKKKGKIHWSFDILVFCLRDVHALESGE